MIRHIFKFLLLASLFFSPLCFGAWKLKKTYDDVSIHVSTTSKTRLTASYTITPKEDRKITKKYMKNLESLKRKILAEVNLTDFKTYKTKIKKDQKTGVTRVEVKGSYLNPSNKKVHFVEYHFYSSTKMLKMVLTNSNKRALKQDAKLNKLTEFTKKYGF